MLWHEQMQIALVEQDIEKLDQLTGQSLVFTTKKERERALYLLAEASKLMHTLQNQTLQTMQKLKKNREFLQATQESSLHKLNKRF